jgi:rhodanese-related sulfurtransferase
MQNMKTIKPPELQQLLSKRGTLALLDVRTSAEFNAEHVTSARNIPLDQLDPARLVEEAQISKLEPVYLLCRSGGRATRAAEKFAQAGLDNAVVVEGGTQGWIEAGLPVERGTSKIISLERQVRIGAGSLVVLGVLLGIFVHPYFIALPAFVGTGLVFAGATDWCGMGLLLAKAPWNSR